MGLCQPEVRIKLQKKKNSKLLIASVENNKRNSETMKMTKIKGSIQIDMNNGKYYAF